MRVKFFIFCLLILTPCFAPRAIGQVPDPVLAAQAPMPGSDHRYIGVGAETVNPADGSVNFELPIQMPPGRQLSFPVGIHYTSAAQFSLTTLGVNSSLSWQAINATPYYLNGWGYQLPTYSAQSFTLSSEVNPANRNETLYCDAARNYTFQGFDGVQRNLRLSNTWPDPANPATDTQCLAGTLNSSLHGVQTTTPVSYVRSVTQPALTVTDQSGTVFQFPSILALSPSDKTAIGFWGLLAQTITDRNGNQITYAGASNGGTGLNNTGFAVASGSYKDTLGRQIVAWSGLGSTTGDTLSVSGLPGNITVHWENVSVNFPETGHETSGAGTCQMGNTSVQQISGVSEIDLPNGQKYSFTYDTTDVVHGLVSRITLPGGGYVRYVWGLNSNSAATLQQWTPSGGAAQSCYFLYDTPAITDRFVSYNGTQEVLHQQFVYATNWIPSTLNTGPPQWSTKTTTVTTTDMIGAQTTTTIYSYVGITPDQGNNDASARVPNTAVPVEQQIAYKNGTGTALKTENKTWMNAFALIGDQTILDNGQGSAVQRCYDANEQLSYLYEYGFQSEGLNSGDPACYASAFQNASASNSAIVPLNDGTFGPLRRLTTTVYHNFLGSTPAAHIVNEPDSITVTDGSGNELKQTTFAFDGNSLQPSGVATGWVPVSTARGNITSVTNWNSFGASPVTTYIYFDTGQVQSKTDPCGNTTCSDMTGTNHTTSYSYSDTPGFEPSGVGQTNAYLTGVTYPNTGVAHTESFTWGYGDGLLRSHTDQNGQSTHYVYNTPPSSCGLQDNLNRLSEIDYIDGGKTTFCYNDPALTVTTSKLLSSTAAMSTAVVMDSMGHVIQDQLITDPDGEDSTDTFYNGMGLVYSHSNPHRASSSPTDGTTTYFYDGLGRTCLVVPSDGTLPTTSVCAARLANDVFIQYVGPTTTVTDQAGKARQTVTEGLGRLAKVFEDPFGSNLETDYTYDSLDRLTNVVQSGSRQRSFSYDSLSRLLSATNPETGRVCYSATYRTPPFNCTDTGYDVNGNLTTKTDARNIATTYSYDALNRLTKKTYSDGTPTVMFGYDQTSILMCAPQSFPVTNGIGRLSWSTPVDQSGNPTSMTAYSYDPVGRVTLFYQCPPLFLHSGQDVHVSYTYDLAGNLKTALNGAGVTISYAYDGAGRPAQATSSLQDAQHPGSLVNVDTSAGFWPTGSLRKLVYGNGLTETIAYNRRMQFCRYNLNSSGAGLSTCTDAIPSGNLQDFKYTPLT